MYDHNAGPGAEHIEPVMMQIERLEEAIYGVQFEQHWLQSQTDRQEVGVFTNPSFVFVSSRLLVHGWYIGYHLSERV
jgi:hypothetical protein